MPSKQLSISPHSTPRPTSVRKAYIQNLTDLLHVCLLRGELDRAKRAWSILIRCREVDWRSRWNWGLLILNHTTEHSTHSPEPSDGRDVDKWLKGLRLSAPESEKPALLHALTLHLIKHGQYRSALGELETYLPSYPYMLSGPLHTYAGLLCFYLAQPESMRAAPALGPNSPIDISMDETSSQPNAALLRAARGWFVKAQTVDEHDEVAKEFIQLIDHPELSEYGTEDNESKDEDEDDGKSVSSESRGWNEVSDESS